MWHSSHKLSVQSAIVPQAVRGTNFILIESVTPDAGLLSLGIDRIVLVLSVHSSTHPLSDVRNTHSVIYTQMFYDQFVGVEG